MQGIAVVMVVAAVVCLLGACMIWAGVHDYKAGYNHSMMTALLILGGIIFVIVGAIWAARSFQELIQMDDYAKVMRHFSFTSGAIIGTYILALAAAMGALALIMYSLASLRRREN